MQLKVLSWNIWWDGEFGPISEFLKASGADIIGLQEVVSDDLTRDVIGYLEGLGYHHMFAPAMKTKDGRTAGNAVFTKRDIIHSKTYVLSETESRNAVRADIELDGTTLHIFSTHLLHTHQKPSEIQEAQAENLIKALPSESTIVMGDFNAIPESAALRKMSGVLKNTDFTLAPTWSVYREGCSVCLLEEVRYRLYYIFTSKDIETASAQVHRDAKGSDHLPVSAVIEVSV